MGKSKKRKVSTNKHSPTGLQSVSEVEFELTAGSAPGALQEIIEKVSISVFISKGQRPCFPRIWVASMPNDLRKVM